MFQALDTAKTRKELETERCSLCPEYILWEEMECLERRLGR